MLGVGDGRSECVWRDVAKALVPHMIYELIYFLKSI